MRAQQPIDVRAIVFGNLAQMWRTDYVDNPKIKLVVCGKQNTGHPWYYSSSNSSLLGNNLLRR